MRQSNQAQVRDPDDKRLHRYNRTKLRLMLLRLGIGWLAGGLAVASGTFARTERRATRRTRSTLAGRTIAIVLWSLISWSISWPLRYLSGYVVEHRYDLSGQPRRGWITDDLKALLLTILFVAPVANAVLEIIRRWPRRWWLIVAGLATPAMALMAQLAPVLIAPLFNHYEPLKNEALAQRLQALASRSGVQVAGVMQMDLSRQTNKANAFFMGIGATRRIVLADTLLDNFSDDEIEVIVAHEIAHQAHRDIWRLIGVETVAITFGAYLTDRLAHRITRQPARSVANNLSRPGSFLLLAWLGSIVGAVLQPVQNAYSRRIERQADTFALELTRDPSSFISAMQRLSRQNLADPYPSAAERYLLLSHPPIQERTQRAVEFERQMQVRLVSEP